MEWEVLTEAVQLERSIGQQWLQVGLVSLMIGVGRPAVPDGPRRSFKDTSPNCHREWKMLHNISARTLDSRSCG
jgi:hypothetical protein